MTDGKAVIVDNGAHRAIVGEHPDQVYLSVGAAQGGSAMFLNPVDALAIAAALIEGAARVLERQFQKRLGSP